jgi:outer membrane protein OmpA-like peptidoglycan-associated protein
MTGKLLGSLVLGLALAGATPAPAQSAKGNPSSDDIIKALKPASQAPAISLNVTFELGSAELTPAAKDIVKTLAAAMNSDQLSGYRFQVEGHTDSTGTPDANMDLSQRRANAVREDLISEYNVPGDRLVAVGKGQNEPIDPAHPEAAANRRVQIVNLGASSQ